MKISKIIATEFEQAEHILKYRGQTKFALYTFNFKSKHQMCSENLHIAIILSLQIAQRLKHHEEIQWSYLLQALRNHCYIQPD